MIDPSSLRPGLRTWLCVTCLAPSAVVPLEAQEIALARFETAILAAPPAPAPARAPTFAAPGPMSPARTRAPFPRLLAGTIIGGALGAGAGLLGGAALGSVQADQDGFISATEAFAVVGLAVGYPVGAAVGARKAATIEGAAPSLGRLLLISAASAAAGGFVWNRIGEGFESRHNTRSWQVGAGAGVLTHWLLTSFGARHAPRISPDAERAPRPEP